MSTIVTSSVDVVKESPGWVAKQWNDAVEYSKTNTYKFVMISLSVFILVGLIIGLILTIVYGLAGPPVTTAGVTFSLQNLGGAPQPPQPNTSASSSGSIYRTSPYYMGLKIVSAYLQTAGNPNTGIVGLNIPIFYNEQCGGNPNCDVATAANLVTTYIDLAQASPQVNADLDASAFNIAPQTYYGIQMNVCNTVPTTTTNVEFQAIGMATAYQYTYSTCNVFATFATPLVAVAGGNYTISLAYDLQGSITVDTTGQTTGLGTVIEGGISYTQIFPSFVASYTTN